MHRYVMIMQARIWQWGGGWSGVHQLKLLLKITLIKNCDFCDDKSKSKNANHVL